MKTSELAGRPAARFLPHAPPMVLIDRVISVGEDEFEAETVIRVESPFCDGAKVDAWVGIEYMAQAVAAFAGAQALAAGKPVKTGFLLGTRLWDCRESSFKVGAVLRIGVKKVLHEPDGLSVVECTLRHAGEERPLVTANLAVYEVADLAAYLASGAS